MTDAILAHVARCNRWRVFWRRESSRMNDLLHIIKKVADDSR